MEKRPGLFYENKKITDKLINRKYPISNSSDLQTRGQHSEQKVKSKHESVLGLGLLWRKEKLEEVPRPITNSPSSMFISRGCAGCFLLP